VEWDMDEGEEDELLDSLMAYPIAGAANKIDMLQYEAFGKGSGDKGKGKGKGKDKPALKGAAEMTQEEAMGKAKLMAKLLGEKGSDCLTSF
jgi:hypothetical protein